MKEKRKKIVLPLLGRKVCGHGTGPYGITGLKCVGIEEGARHIIYKGIEFIAHVTWTDCDICNRRICLEVAKSARELFRNKEEMKKREIH